MANFASPNVFIQEVPAATAQEGVSASQIGVVGFTQRGPINKPIKVRSLEEFSRTFGPNIRTTLVPLTVEQFFKNGGRVAVVVRVVPANSLEATAVIDSPTKFTINATAPGDWGNSFRVAIQGNANFLDETIGSENWKKYDLLVEEPDQFGTFLADEIFEAVQFTNDTGSDFVSNVVNDTTTGSNFIQILEAAGGTPNGFGVQTITAELLATGDGTKKRFKGTVLGLNTVPPTLALSGTPGNVNNGQHNYLVTFVNAQGIETIAAPPTAITVVDHTTSGQVNLTAIPLGAVGAGVVKRNIYRTAAGGINYQLLTIINDNTTTIYTDNTFDVNLGVTVPNSAYPDPALILRNTGGATKVTFSVVVATITKTITDDGFGNLTSTVGVLDPSGNNRFDYQTGTFDFTLLTSADAASSVTTTYKRLPSVLFFPLSGGSNGVGVLTRNEVTHPSLIPNLEGMYAFNKLQDIVNIAIPDFAGDATVGRDQVDYAASRRDRFIILTTPRGSSIPAAQIFVTNSLARTDKHAAVYYPWLKWLNTATGGNDVVPPLGAIAGIFARTDANKNVSKAPAGKDDGAIIGAVGPEFDLGIEDRDRLFPRKINPIANSAATGFAVWGDRTLSDDVNFRFIGVTRLFMFMEEFVFIRLQPFLFENNGPALWTRVRNTLNGDFTTFFNQHYFAEGAVKSDSFFIRVDETNNTQADIDAGILNVDIGIAPNKPAEFIVVRFQPLATPRI